MKGTIKIGEREFPCTVQSNFESTGMFDASGLSGTLEHVEVYATALVHGTDNSRYVLRALGERDEEPEVRV